MAIIYAIPKSAKQFAIADIYRALSRNLLQHCVAHASPLDEIAKGNELIEHGGIRDAAVLKVD